MKAVVVHEPKVCLLFTKEIGPSSLKQRVLARIEQRLGTQLGFV